MAKGKLFERLNDITHCETGFDKCYTSSVVDMLNDAKEDFPNLKSVEKKLTPEMIKYHRDREHALYMLLALERGEWAKRWLGLTFVTEQTKEQTK